MAETPLGPGWERHSPVSDSFPWVRAGSTGIAGIWEVSLRAPKAGKAIKGDRTTLGRLWKAVLKVGHELGVHGNLARSIAREVAGDLGPTIIISEEKQSGQVRVVASHLCQEACGGNVGQCLTALVVETVIQGKMVEPIFASDTIPGAGGTCEVVLAPFRLELKAPLDTEGEDQSPGPIAISP